MSYGFHIRKLEYVGNNKRSSIIIKKGLNVIYGPTSTGKSFMFDSLNFMLGSKDRPEAINEIQGFEKIQMEIKSNKGEVYTLERKIEGGSFKKFECAIDKIQDNSEFEVLGSTNNAKKSVSKFFLALSGFKETEYKLKKNVKNELDRFSYRSMNHLIMADEVRIIVKKSPIYSEVIQSKTKEKSVLKLLLTNMDDSELTIENKESDNPLRKGKLELIENLIQETKAELEKLENSKGDFDNLTEDINALTSIKNGMLKDIEQLTQKRNSLWKEVQAFTKKELSINGLIKRFTLLESQYDSDLERLIFLSEGSHYFKQLSLERCPVCHQELNNDNELHEEHYTSTENKNEAVKVEIIKIKKHKRDLEETITSLENELKEAQENKMLSTQKYESINEEIEQELQPNLNKIDKQLDEILRKHTEINHLLFLENNLKKLKTIKKQIETLQTKSKSKEVSEKNTSITNYIEDLCRKIETLLKDWDFPESKVTFDFDSFDIIIGDIKRSMYGKGYRAIAFSAFIIGLMNYCFDNNLPHPGVVILDSPLTTYKEEDTPEDELPEEIQYKFYESLSKLRHQVIVFENKKPQPELLSKINFIEFTKNSRIGRYGFIEN